LTGANDVAVVGASVVSGVKGSTLASGVGSTLSKAVVKSLACSLAEGDVKGESIVDDVNLNLESDTVNTLDGGGGSRSRGDG
jgi:hypothetical protein